MRSPQTVFQILLMSAFKRFYMGTRLSNILKTTKATKFIKTIPESTYKVVLDTYDLVAPTRPISLLRAVSFKQLLTFRFLQLLLYLEKSCAVILFRSLTQVSQSTLKTTSIGSPITEKRPFKKLKILSFVAPFISKIKTVGIFNFLSVRYFRKGLLFLKT